MLHLTLSTTSRGRAALGSLALAAVLVLCLAGAGPAFADRACTGDPLLTGRTCSEAECITLQADVNLKCKSPAPVGCNNLSGCNVLRREKQRWLDCAISRDRINARCWSGGDAGHQQASAQAWQNVGTCQARIALPEPVGCADPCPLASSGAGAPSAAEAAAFDLVLGLD